VDYAIRFVNIGKFGTSSDRRKWQRTSSCRHVPILWLLRSSDTWLARGAAVGTCGSGNAVERCDSRLPVMATKLSAPCTDRPHRRTVRWCRAERCGAGTGRLLRAALCVWE